MTDSIEERVRRIVADVLGLPYEQITSSTSHKSVAEWDSMGMINMAMALEAEFQVTLSIEDVAKLVSVQAVTEIVRQGGGR